MERRPLADVFSDQDLALIAAGRCPYCRRMADERLRDLLSDPAPHPRATLAALGQWFTAAADHGDDITGHYRGRLRSDVCNHKSFYQTVGELMVAFFLEKQQGWTLCYILPDPRRGPTPEFVVRVGDTSLNVEVKTIVDGIGVDFTSACPVASRAPRIRNLVKDGVPKLAKSERNLVFIVGYCRPPIPASDLTDALYGTLHLRIPLYRDGRVGDCRPARDGDGRLKPTFNTRVGAVGLLEQSRFADCACCFVHNAYAVRPIPYSTLDPCPQLTPDEEEQRLVCRNSDWSLWS